MRVSHLFGETLRDAPSDAEIASHRLLLRAGYVRQLGAGIFSYLPLGWRSLRKIEAILREEMDRIGGQEMNMPVVHPAELWKETGRWATIDDSLARFHDRSGRDLVLAMTHEEVVASLAASEIASYRQLPQLVYHVQTKFRDEPRSRGGLIRVREFVMKDSYSLDRDEEGLEAQYEAHYRAYLRIGRRLGLPLLAVRSDVGMMGGHAAHEFMYVTPVGEDTLVRCGACGYAANREVADFRKEPEPAEPAAPLEEVPTPAADTIAALAETLDLPPSRLAKAVFFTEPAADGREERLVLAVVRGDHEVVQARVQALSGAETLRPARDEEIRARGAVPGYASPVGLDADDLLVVVDDLVRDSANLATGANREGHHLLNANFGRDFEADVVGPIAAAFDGAPCATCGEPLELVRGIEVGNIFQLGTRYTAALGATYTGEDGVDRPVVMGSYGIGVGRALACVAEEHHTERGLALPISVAPFHVALVALGRSDDVREAAETLYRSLEAEGVEVLYDDRDASAGVKFADADLRGLPLRATVSERSLAKGGVEVRRRVGGEDRIVPVGEAPAAVREEIDALRRELEEAYPPTAAEA